MAGFFLLEVNEKDNILRQVVLRLCIVAKININPRRHDFVSGDLHNKKHQLKPSAGHSVVTGRYAPSFHRPSDFLS